MQSITQPPAGYFTPKKTNGTGSTYGKKIGLTHFQRRRKCVVGHK